MIKIKVLNNYSWFLGFESYFADLKELLRSNFSFMKAGAKHSTEYRQKKWDGLTHMITAKGRFGTGLLGSVIVLLKEKNYRVTLEDLREKPIKSLDASWVGYDLRAYQQEIVDRGSQVGRGLFELPTRGGKTGVAGSLIKMLGVPTLYVVVGKESMYQTASNLEEYLRGVSIGCFGDGKKDIDTDIVVCIINSLQRVNLKELFDRPLLIIDEVHTSPARGAYQALMKSQAYYRFGMTGTLIREDGAGMKMRALTGRVFYKKPAKEMWEEKHIMMPIIEWVNVNATPIHRSVPYPKAYEYGIVESVERNQAIADVVIRHPDEQILISTERVAHVEIISKCLDANAIPHCKLMADSRDRGNITKSFAEGAIRILVASRILNQSVTFPSLSVVVNAAGRKSAVELFQRIGRALGIKAGKASVKIYDFIDAHHPILMRHSSMRAAKLEGRNYKQINLGGFE